MLNYKVTSTFEIILVVHIYQLVWDLILMRV